MQYFRHRYASSFVYEAVSAGCYSATSEDALIVLAVALYQDKNTNFLFDRIILKSLRAAYQSHS